MSTLLLVVSLLLRFNKYNFCQLPVIFCNCLLPILSHIILRVSPSGSGDGTCHIWRAIVSSPEQVRRFLLLLLVQLTKEINCTAENSVFFGWEQTWEITLASNLGARDTSAGFTVIKKQHLEMWFFCHFFFSWGHPSKIQTLISMNGTMPPEAKFEELLTSLLGWWFLLTCSSFL